MHDEAELDTSDITGVYKSKDSFSRLNITVVLTKAGRERMLSMTSSNIDRHAVMFVNGQAVSAPVINAPYRSNKFPLNSDKDRDELFRALTQPELAED